MHQHAFQPRSGVVTPLPYCLPSCAAGSSIGAPHLLNASRLILLVACSIAFLAVLPSLSR